VLADMGRAAASYPTIWRTLRRAAQTNDSETESAVESGVDGAEMAGASGDSARVHYRDRIADLCFAHALSRSLSSATLPRFSGVTM
jgi:hypothetical protein